MPGDLLIALKRSEQKMQMHHYHHCQNWVPEKIEFSDRQIWIYTLLSCVSILCFRFYTMDKPITGSCHCKKIKFSSAYRPMWISICHCRICQKSYGNTSAIFVAFEKGSLVFTLGAPKFYNSSNIAMRGICSVCGSPIIFSYENLDAVLVGTLDDPENWQPNGCHLGIESQVPWDIIHDSLPQYRTEDDPAFIEENK